MSTQSIVRFLTDTPLGQLSFLGGMSAAGAVGAFCCTTANPLLGVAFGANYVALTIVATLVTEKILERKLSNGEHWLLMGICVIPASLITFGIASFLGLSVTAATIALLPIVCIAGIILLILGGLGIFGVSLSTIVCYETCCCCDASARSDMCQELCG